CPPSLHRRPVSPLHADTAVARSPAAMPPGPERRGRSVGHVSRAPGASAFGAMAARAPATIAPTPGSPPANDRCLLGVSPLLYGASCVPPGASRGRWVSRAAPVSGGAGGSAMLLSPTRQLVTSRERSKPTRWIMPPASKVKLQTEEKSPWDG